MGAFYNRKSQVEMGKGRTFACIDSASSPPSARSQNGQMWILKNHRSTDAVGMGTIHGASATPTAQPTSAPLRELRHPALVRRPRFRLAFPPPLPLCTHTQPAWLGLSSSLPKSIHVVSPEKTRRSLQCCTGTFLAWPPFASGAAA